MKIAVTGANGLFGYGLAEIISTRHTVFPLTRADADITKADEVRDAFARLQPDVVIHPAGIPDIDVCELRPDQAFLVNVHGTRHVVEAAKSVGARVVYISTDAVFDGKKNAPYREADPKRPPSVYGRTKSMGEEIVRAQPESWAFRVSVLFGPGKTNAVFKGLRALAKGEEYVAACDQMGSATYTLDAAAKILEVVEAERYGVYHLSNQEPCTRLELARRAATLAGLDPNKMIGKTSAEMGRPGARLKYATMAMDALQQNGFSLPRPWEEALGEYIQSLGGSWRG